MLVRSASWLVNVVLPCIKYTEVCTSGMNFGACRVCACLLIASVANSSARTLSTFDPLIGDRHWDTSFQIFACSNAIIVGLESVIGGCHRGIADCFMALDKTLDVGVESQNRLDSSSPIVYYLSTRIAHAPLSVTLWTVIPSITSSVSSSTTAQVKLKSVPKEHVLGSQ
jgi:hypothetical protein